MAAETNSKECLELLLLHGAEVNILNNVSHFHVKHLQVCKIALPFHRTE